MHIRMQLPRFRRFFFALAAAGAIAMLIAGQWTRTVHAQGSEAPPSSVQGKAQGPAAMPEPLGPSSWLAGAVYPTTISRYAFVQVDEDAYVISGVSNSAVVTAVRRYNASTNMWTTLAPIPVGSEAPAAAFYNGKIYVAGGAGVSALQIYDVATNTWSSGAARPATDSYGAAAGASGGKVYVVGGGSAGASTTLSIYDIGTNTWSAGAAAPSAFLLAGYTQVGQYLYIIGGFAASPAANSTVSMRLDMAGPTWTTGPAWTPGRADFGLALFGSRLVAMGGDTNGGGYFEASALVNELDISTWPTGTWLAAPSNLPTARQANQAGFSTTGRVGGEIWSTGGITPNLGSFLADHLYRSRPTVSFTGAPLGGGSVGYPGFSGFQSNRVFRTDPASTCVTSKAYPGTFTDGFAHAYDAYRIPNVSGRSECVSVTVTTACTFIHASAYLTSFNPSDISANWIADIGGSPNPTKTFSFNIPNGQTAILVVSDATAGSCASYNVTMTGSNWHTSFDTNRDFRTDFSVFRPGTNTWYTALSDGGATSTVWGGAGDMDVMGDYDGDGKADIAVFRPSDGNWYIVQSSTGTVRISNWGGVGDIPLVGDIDGDGKDDLTIYRNGSWYTLKSGGGFAFVNWGAASDLPILADFDGDGKADPTVFRPSNGFWYGYLSGGGALVYGWGQNGDTPVAGNWDGDAKADVAVYRPSTGQWFVSQSSAGSLVVPWGAATDIPVSGDWDGDGRSDFAVWRPATGTWYIQYAIGGSATVVWGAFGDKVIGRRPGS